MFEKQLQAKAMYALSKKKSKLFRCMEEKTVGFKILHALSEAVENDFTSVTKELKKSDPVFHDFLKKTGEFQK